MGVHDPTRKSTPVLYGTRSTLKFLDRYNVTLFKVASTMAVQCKDPSSECWSLHQKMPLPNGIAAAFACCHAFPEAVARRNGSKKPDQAHRSFLVPHGLWQREWQPSVQRGARCGAGACWQRPLDFSALAAGIALSNGRGVVLGRAGTVPLIS